MQRPPCLLAIAGAALLVLGGTSCRTARPGAPVIPCLEPSAAAERLRDRVRQLAAAAGADERARRDAYGLLPAGVAAVAVERDPTVCTRAARAYAAALRTAVPEVPLRPVALVRAGPERYVAVDPSPTPKSEWSAALVFTRDFRRVVGRFTF